MCRRPSLLRVDLWVKPLGISQLQVLALVCFGISWAIGVHLRYFRDHPGALAQAWDSLYRLALEGYAAWRGAGK